MKKNFKGHFVVLNGALALVVATLAVIPSISGAAAAPITGTVFRDHNQNGSQDARDIGIEGVVVIAVDAAGTEAGRATSTSDGTYTLSGTDDGEQYRLSIEWTASYLQPSAIGTDNGSTIRFANGGDAVDFSLANPADFCASNAATVEYATTCFVNGDPTGVDELNGALATIVSEVQSSGNASTATKYATAAETGSVYGLAWEPSSSRLFTSAYLKRHVGLGDGGIDAIYEIDGASVGLWYDQINTDPGSLVPTPAVRALPDDSGDSPGSLDPLTFGLIGKVGFGDIDLSDDGSLLFAANLGDRNIYEIDVAAADGGSTTAHRSLGAPALSCTNGVARPFGMQIRDGVLYAGYTCTGESGGTVADVSGNVFTYDFGTDSWAGSAILTIPFDYAEGCTVRANGCANYSWEDTFSYANFNFTADTGNAFELPLRPQPMLADIEFDTDGSMIIGVRDRQADQFGHRNLTPNGDGNLLTAANNGDLLRAAPPASIGGTYVLESAGVVGGVTSTGTGTTNQGPGGPTSGQGPGGGEFYWGDFVSTSSTVGFHSETIIGGLAQVLGEDVTAASITDPIFNQLDAGGLAWANLDTGANDDLLQLYRDNSDPQPSTFGKANGLGDVEALCAASPVQIGNRVWFDRNGDGIQDAGEEPIPGVTITLSDSQTTTSDANGVWSLFVAPTTAYTVSLDPSTADVSGITEITDPSQLSPTRNNQGGNDEVDSDIDPLTLTVAITSGAPGIHDHSIDAGFGVATLEIGNLVWLDTDNDGIAESGEPGIADVTVQLWQDTNNDGTKETFIADQMTDADGHYRFTGLPTGAYGIVIPSQSGVGEPLEDMWSSTPTAANAGDGNDNDDNGIDPAPQPDELMSSVVSLLGIAEPASETLRSDDPTADAPTIGVADTASNLTIDFGFFPVSSIGNFVWLDDDEDGLQSGSDTGVPDVTVNLCDAFGNVLDTTTTAADGSYLFDGLAPGDYKVCFDLSTLPDDHAATAADAGSDDALDSDANPITGMTPVTTLDSGEDDDSWDLGVFVNTNIYEVGNLVWLDNNNNGIAESGEPGIPAVSVELYAGDGAGAKGTLVATTVTDGSGHYRFTNLAAGDYLVNLPDQSGSGQPLEGRASSTPTQTDPNTDVDNDDNGLDPAASIDGVMSATITLGSDAEPAAEQLRSDDATPEGTSLADERSNLTVDFGFFPTSTLGQTIWVDEDQDGQRDPGEAPVPDVTVHLCTASGVILATTQTDADGNFIFDGLAPGDYKICIDLDTIPDGYTFTTQNVGDDRTDSDVDPTTGMSDVVTLGIDKEDLTTFAGLLPPASVGDKVWFDADQDGFQDATEAPVPGVTVNLCDADMNTLASTTTDSNGMYLFDGLEPGTYKICFDLATIPPLRAPTVPNVGNDATDSDADPITGATDTFTLDAGEFNPTLDLGLVPTTGTLPVTGSSFTGMLFGLGLMLVGGGTGLIAVRRRLLV